MSASPQDTLHSDRLLLRRELLFAQVAQIEETIEDILGETYPFPEPPDLPSRQKRRAKKAASRKKAKGSSAGKGAAAVRLRPLQDGEAGYCLIWRQEDGEERRDWLEDGAPLASILKYPSGNLQPIRIETVDKEGKCLEILWQTEITDHAPENSEKEFLDQNLPHS
ncbi:MAG: hypothetical protein JJT75_00035 [Opitutales bacterium]|nr:hypothetical protein [Opitutales bacterium]MCH8539478.1 hypothetical protein [Opitutales bacterium]